ncbi:MAG: metallophosphoesterase [Chloroflexi bacterium]|nr:metallophosphoesterase [Chloroflexota bacterium]
MRIAVLSDAHSNLNALKAALNDSQKRDVERYWFLGDAVGYGPRPVAPLMFLKRYVHPDDWVMGNHDAMMADLLLPDDLAELGDGHRAKFEIRERGPDNKPTGEILYKGSARAQLMRMDEWEETGPTPIQAIELNRAALKAHPEADAFWRAEFTKGRVAPRIHTLDGVDHILTHARQNDLGRYIYGWQHDIFLPAEFHQLKMQADESGRPRIQWQGHTHVPTMVKARSIRNGDFEFDAVRIRPEETYPLDSDLALVNPGSVGQPRDLDPRAAYAVLETTAREVTFYRVPYDWRATAQDMNAQGYPESLVRRLRDATPTGSTPPSWLEHYEQARAIGPQEEARNDPL